MIAGGCGGVGVCVDLFSPLTVLEYKSASSMDVFVSSRDISVSTPSMSVSYRASHKARGRSFVGRVRAMPKMVVIRHSGVVIESEKSRSLIISASYLSHILSFAAISSWMRESGGAVVVVVTPLVSLS